VEDGAAGDVVRGPLPAFDFPPNSKNELFCHPATVEKFEPLRQEYAAKLGVGELRVFSTAMCPPDEAWIFDHTGKLTRLVWGERHSKAMAVAGALQVDANGSPVETL
jgi:hypothetical protein